MEILLTTVDATNSDMRRGYPVAVDVDGAAWGRAEIMSEWKRLGGSRAQFPCPWLALLRVPGLPLDKNVAEVEVDYQGNRAGDAPPTEVGQSRITRVRNWIIPLDDPGFPAAVRDALDQPGGEATVTVGQFTAIGMVRRISDGLHLPTTGAIANDRRTASSERARLNLVLPPVVPPRARPEGRLWRL